MKRFLIPIAFIAVVGSQAPATGYPIDKGSHLVTTINVEAVKHRVRERVRERLHDWFAEKVDALTAPAPVAEPTPSAAPSPTTSYPSGVLSAEEVGSYARNAGFPESVVPEMVAIAYRESRFNPNAINSSSGACGLWQLYPCPGSGALDPARNAALAYSKYQASGLAPWGG